MHLKFISNKRLKVIKEFFTNDVRSINKNNKQRKIGQEREKKPEVQSHDTRKVFR